MSNIYFLKSDDSQISADVKVGTIGNAGSVIRRLRSGGTSVFAGSSQPTDNGNITGAVAGPGKEIINSTLVVTTSILVGKTDDLDQAFQNLAISVTLHGGLDGDQTFQVGNADKSEFTETRSIVAALAIKFQSQQP